MIDSLFYWAKSQYPYHRDLNAATVVAVEESLRVLTPELYAWREHGIREGYVAITNGGKVEVVRK